MIPGTSSALSSSLSFLEGEQWGGIPEFSVTVLGVPPSDNAASVIMQFKQNALPVLTLTSAGGDITITSAANWTFEIPAQTINLRAGTYQYAIQITDVNGAALTYLADTMTVLPPAIIPV